MKERYLAVALLVLLCGCGGSRQSVESVTPEDVASMEVLVGFVHDSRLDDEENIQSDTMGWKVML